MDRTKTTLERAFELAASGKYLTLAEIRWRLRAEGHADWEIVGPSLTKQLKDLLHRRADSANQT